MLRWLVVLVGGLVCLSSASVCVEAQEQAGAHSEQAEEKWDALNQHGLSLYRQGNYGEATAIAEDAYAFAENALGAEHLDTLTSVNNLALFYQAQGRYGEAEPLYHRALEARERLLGTEHPDTLISLNNLAFLYQAQGRYGEAKSLHAYALATRERVLGAEHPSTLISLNNLAVLYYSQGRYGEAEPLYERALEARERVLGAEHPSTLTSLNNLAALYRAQGRYGEAAPLYEQALEASQRVLGTEHPDTLGSLNNLAVLYETLGRHSEAEPLHEQALEARERVLGTEHPDTLGSLNNLAALYRAQGRHGEAEPLYEQALEASENRLGPEHPSTLTSLNNLAALYQTRRRFGEAELLYKRALEARERVLGAEHPDTLTSLNNLAFLYEVLGRHSEAEPLYERVVVQGESILGTNHVRRSAHFGNYARTLNHIDAALRPAAVYYQKQAVNILQSVRANMSDLHDETQAAFLNKKAYHYETLQKWLIEEGRFAEAEQVGRMLKEQEFFEFVRRSDVDGKDPRATRSNLTARESEWAAQLASWQERPNMIGAELAALKTRKRGGDKLSALEQAQLTDLEAKYEVAYAEYKGQVDAWLASVRDLSDETIQAEARALEARYHDDLQGEIADIGDDVAALQVVAFEESLHFFLITPNAFKHIETPIKRAELNAAVFAARAAMQPDEDERLDPKAYEKLYALYKVLFAPVEQELADAGTETLMLNLQGAIRYVPFAALYDGKEYLAQRYELALFTPAARTRFEPAARMDEASGFGVTKAHTFEGLGTFLALSGVRAELETLLGRDGAEGILSGTPQFDEAFTKASFAAALEERKPIVHVASHFLMRPGNDSNSFLLMGDGSALTLAEINTSAGLRFRGVELLTLSACSTGLSSQGDFDVDSATGVEVEGFGVLAQRKGAEAVIASLWDVSDGSTSQLMEALYEGLASGEMNKAEALQAAQLKLIGQAETTHPYFWAPFILMGNWK